MQTDAGLFEEDRTTVVQFDGDGHAEHDWRRDDER